MEGNIEYLNIYSIELNVKQFFIYQLCFQSYRVHRDKVDAIRIIHFNGKEEEEIEIYIYYHFCDILIAKIDGYSSIVTDKYIKVP